MNKFVIVIVFILMSFISRGQSFVIVSPNSTLHKSMSSFKENGNYVCFFEQVYEYEQKGWVICDDCDENVQSVVNAYLAYSLIKEGVTVSVAIDITDTEEQFWPTLFYNHINHAEVR